MKFSPRFLMKLSAKISCEVSFSRHMSPKMTDFHLIPSSADDGTLRGFPFWEVFRQLLPVFVMRPKRMKFYAVRWKIWAKN